MFRKSLLTLGCLGVALLAIAQEPKSAPAATRTLKVKLSYTGTGTVDEKHQIIVFLFDTPDFVQGNGIPIGTKSAKAKNETVSFTDITTSPVYIVATYDPSGGYDGASGPPPSGSSIGLHASSGQPDPIKIEPGKTVEIELTFDDTIKMP